MKPRGVFEELAVGQEEQSPVDEEDEHEDAEHAPDQPGIVRGCRREAAVEKVEEPAQRPVERLADHPCDDRPDESAGQPGRDLGGER